MAFWMAVNFWFPPFRFLLLIFESLHCNLLSLPSTKTLANVNEAKCLNRTLVDFHPLFKFASKRSRIAHTNKLYQCRSVSLKNTSSVLSFHCKARTFWISFSAWFFSARRRSKKFHEIEWIWYPPACGAYKVPAKLNELNIIHYTMQCLNGFETGRVLSRRK